MLDTLNFRHLYYFWVIAREGSMARASDRLDLAPQTLSGQLASLEEAVGGLLFRREHRRLVMTDLGQTVYGYANDMFAIADELCQVVRSAPTDRPLHLKVGVSASIHKLIAFHLVEPGLTLGRDVQLTCRTGRVEDLLRELNRQELDVLLTDRVPSSDGESGWHLHELGQSSISLFAAPDLAHRLVGEFPGSLNGQPFLANALDAPYLHQLTRWFSEKGVRVRLKAEIDDSALIKVFGRQGLGVFAAPTAVADEVCRQYNVVCIGAVDDVADRFFAMTRSRRTTHPAVEAICRQSISGMAR